MVAYPSSADFSPGLSALSGTAPTSHISVPLGCAIRKHATDILVVASSSFLKRKRSGSEIFRLPQLKTYKRSDLGGPGALCWACAARGAMRAARESASFLNIEFRSAPIIIQNASMDA